MNDTDAIQITEIVTLYFNGTYQGDTEQLNRAFHANAHITGILNGDYIDWTLADFIKRVTTKPSSAEKGEKFDKKILSIHKTNHAAVVTAQVGVGDMIFTDYISLLKINEQWVIRHKCFTN